MQDLLRALSKRLQHRDAKTLDFKPKTENLSAGFTTLFQPNSTAAITQQRLWSEDNSKEIEKGWILKADSVSELSKLLQLEEMALQLSIGKYNHFCRSGVDSDFGRSPDTLKPIEPPYYAMQLMPLLYNTQGGSRRDKQARVLDPDGNPIPRLYAALEFGSIWGFRYQTSTNVFECLVSVRIAGKNAAMSAAAEVKTLI